jgi:hypothetical protein
MGFWFKAQSAAAGCELPSFSAVIDFGDYFNQPLHGANFPAPLQTLALGLRLNQPLHGVNFQHFCRHWLSEYGSPGRRREWTSQHLCRHQLLD